VYRSVDWVVQRLINDRWTSAASAFLVILIASQIWVPEVTAHDWYPVECCRGKDCAEVEHATYAQGPGAGNDLPILTVTTQHGTALVPPNFPRRESMDGKMHACMGPGQGSNMRLICLFVPPPS
jgi:hypothetical protein